MNRKLAAEITVKNPLPIPLNGCCFKVDGANLTGGKTITERWVDGLCSDMDIVLDGLCSDIFSWYCFHTGNYTFMFFLLSI